MTIYRYTNAGLEQVKRTTFRDQDILERRDLQRVLKNRISALFEDEPEEFMVIAEEFSNWDDSRRSIDLLVLGNEGTLAVVELKRTEDGNHMELQALRYAAMISTMTFDDIVDAFRKYKPDEKDPHAVLTDFLTLPEDFTTHVRIVLASANFGRELTTTVLWLNENYGLDIRCVRLEPYEDASGTLLDVQTVIPLPEAQDYQTRLSRKKQEEREVRESYRDFTRYDLEVGGETFTNLWKRGVILEIVRGIVALGRTPERIAAVVPEVGSRMFRTFDDQLSGSAISSALRGESGGAKRGLQTRFFIADDELFHIDGKTYALRNQWGGERFHNTVDALVEQFPEAQISIRPSGEV